MVEIATARLRLQFTPTIINLLLNHGPNPFMISAPASLMTLAYWRLFQADWVTEISEIEMLTESHDDWIPVLCQPDY